MGDTGDQTTVYQGSTEWFSGSASWHLEAAAVAAAVLAMQVVKELMEKMPAFFAANLLSISYCWFYTAYAQDSASKQSKWLKRIEKGENGLDITGTKMQQTDFNQFTGTHWAQLVRHLETRLRTEWYIIIRKYMGNIERYWKTLTVLAVKLEFTARNCNHLFAIWGMH